MPSSSPCFLLRKEPSGRIRLLFHLCIIIGRVAVSRLTFLTFTELWGLPDIYTPAPPPRSLPALLVLPNLGQLLQLKLSRVCCDSPPVHTCCSTFARNVWNCITTTTSEAGAACAHSGRGQLFWRSWRGGWSGWAAPA